MNQPVSPADHVDRHLTLIALGVGLMAIKYLADAVQTLAPAYDVPAEWISDIAALTAVLAILPGMLWLRLKLPPGVRADLLAEDGYVMSVLRRAMRHSWQISWVVLIFADVFVRKRFPEIPVGFAMQATIALMTGLVAISFFVILKAEGADDGEDGA